MAFCQKCGSQVQDGISFCPTCGSQMNVQTMNYQNNGQGYNNQYNGQYQQPQYNNQYNNQYNSNMNMGGGYQRVQKLEIVTAIILTIVTCGIYGIIWLIKMANDANTICNDNGPSGGMVFLLTIVTCGIYGWFFFYNIGKRLNAAGQRYGVQVDDNSVLYLILNLLGLSIVTYCLVQNELNKFAQ